MDFCMTFFLFERLRVRLNLGLPGVVRGTGISGLTAGPLARCDAAGRGCASHAVRHSHLQIICQDVESARDGTEIVDRQSLEVLHELLLLHLSLFCHVGRDVQQSVEDLELAWHRTQVEDPNLLLTPQGSAVDQGRQPQADHEEQNEHHAR